MAYGGGGVELKLARLMVERLGATRSRVEAAVDAAARSGRPFVQVAVETQLVEEDAVADLAARELATVVVELDLGELDDDSVGLVPSEVARRHLFVPLASDPSGESIRVVFADPFDPGAVEAARAATGLGIQPLVATVSGLLSALDRAYGTAPEEDTRVLKTREIAAESTQRVPGSHAAIDPTTSPLHRLQDEATIEQRIEAILLALIDKGVLTRAEYFEALRRLLGRRP